ncbi:hypothetical protein ANN_16079 [Periplaneta americana]|uniref:Uncharacterized protein n=1 Tax=Periplaneta americana TaxID=6978 RepID=A0ABQ8SI44_PERAM|nr:hypothetical protein ANN_16079 [Periplaneta americana]
MEFQRSKGMIEKYSKDLSDRVVMPQGRRNGNVLPFLHFCLFSFERTYFSNVVVVYFREPTADSYAIRLRHTEIFLMVASALTPDHVCYVLPPIQCNRTNTAAAVPAVNILYLTVILPVVLYGCETWTLTLKEEHRLRVFENKVLRKIFGAKRDEVTGEWRKLHNTELHALYSSPDIIRNIKSRRLRWAGHVARTGESRNAYRVLVGRPEGKRPLGRPRRRWEDNIKMDLRESDAETDQEEEKELAGSLAEKKLPIEGYTRKNGEREKSSEQKKISDGRRH